MRVDTALLKKLKVKLLMLERKEITIWRFQNVIKEDMNYLHQKKNLLQFVCT